MYVFCRSSLLLSIALLLWLAVVTSALASIAPIQIGTHSHINFSADAELYIDASGQLSPAEVMERSTEFRSVRQSDLAKIHDTRALWLRARIYNNTTEPIERWLVLDKTRVEWVTLYQATPMGWSQSSSGLSIPQKNKPINTIGIVFPIELAAGETRDVLLRVKSRTIIDLDAKIWKIVDFLQAREKRLQLEWIAVGGSLIATLISLTLYARMRQNSYLFFTTLHIFATLMTLSSVGIFEFTLWPTNIAVPVQIHLISGIAGVISLLLFQRSILDLPHTAPTMSKAFVLLTTAFAMLVPLSFINFLLSVKSFNTMIVLSCLLVMYVALKAWKQGNKATRYLVLAYVIIWLTGAMRAAAFMGILKEPFLDDISITWALLLASPLMILALTERAETLNVQLSNSLEISRTKSALLARVSHDLRTPLNTIIGYAQMLARHSVRLTLQQGTAGIERSGRRLLDMIEDLLDQSQLEAKRTSLNTAPLQLQPWLEDIARDSEIMAASNHNTFSLLTSQSLPHTVKVDATRLRQILDNLLTNANRHTKHGQLELHCISNPTHPSQRVRLSFKVKDTGEGIAEKEIAKIFDPFYKGIQSKASDSKQTSRLGLGLSIARDLARLMDAELRVSSQIGIGSQFSFDIEVDCTAKTEQPSVANGYEVPLFTGRDNLCILTADDDPDALRLLIDHLSSLGLYAHGVDSGDALIAALKRTKWDLIITDQTMLHGDGWTVLRYVREHYPSLPVILVSTTAAHPPSSLPTNLHFDAYVSKPLEAKSLAQTLLLWLPQSPKTNPIASTVPALNKPTQLQMDELAALVRGGHITNIVQWCETLACQYPTYTDYANAVQRAAHHLDFDALDQLSKP